jgi:hypothetical protein
MQGAARPNLAEQKVIPPTYPFRESIALSCTHDEGYVNLPLR